MSPARPPCLLAVALLLSGVPVAAAQSSGDGAESPRFRVIVSTANPLESIARERLARIFIKNLTRWEDGSEIAPVDQSGRAQVRIEFCREVLRAVGMGRLSSVESYWQEQIFSGRGTPPPIVASDDEVVARVKADPAAIGYVSAAPEVDGVKVVEIEGEGGE